LVQFPPPEEFGCSIHGHLVSCHSAPWQEHSPQLQWQKKHQQLHCAQIL